LDKSWAWDQVAVTPLLNKTTVLNTGIPKNPGGTIPNGGHTPPISMLGDREASKKTQKILKKNINSVNKKRMKDSFNMLCIL
jgi:hypothetical protein